METLPCIWMNAGVLSYKLCDRQYECENCPLDAALRGTVTSIPRPDESESTGPRQWEFRPDRHYSATHGWALPLDDGLMRIGLDDFGSFLLGRVSTLVLPILRSRIRQDRSACWLAHDEHLVPFKAPITGTVIRVNREAQKHPALITSSPYDDGWLLEVRCTDPDQGPGALLSADQIRERTSRQVEKISEEISRPHAATETVGPTLADGGERLTELARILGSARYHRLVLGLLS